MPEPLSSAIVCASCALDRAFGSGAYCRACGRAHGARRERCDCCGISIGQGRWCRRCNANIHGNGGALRSAVPGRLFRLYRYDFQNDPTARAREDVAWDEVLQTLKKLGPEEPGQAGRE
jgi:hypothetical protein